MLSGEGNENGEKTTIGLFSKKKFVSAVRLYGLFLGASVRGTLHARCIALKNWVLS